MAAALAQISEGVIVTDADGRIQFVNAAAAHLHGVARLDVAVDEYTDAYHLLTEDGRPYPATELPLTRAVLQGETILDARWRIRRPDGSEILAVGSARPVLGPNGERLGAVLTLRDETVREQAERADRRATRLLAQVSDAHLTLDRELRIRFANPAAERILGVAAETLVGRTHDEAFPASVGTEVERQYRRVVTEGVEAHFTHHYEGDGHDLHAEVDAYPTEDGGVAVFWRDVSRARHAEAALHELNARLTAQNAQLHAQAGELATMNEQLQEGAAELEATNEQLQENATELEMQTQQLQEQAVELEAANEQLQANAVELEAQTEELQATTAHLEERAAALALSAAAGAAVTEERSLRRVLQRCTEAVVEHLDAAFARIWTLNEGTQVLELEASAGLYTHLNGPHGRVPVGAFKIGRIAEERRPHLTNDVPHDPRVSDQAWARREGMVAFAGYPLVIGDQLVGVLGLFARRALAEDTLRALGTVADGIAVAIRRARVEAALRESEGRFRTMADQAPVMLWVTEPDGACSFLNTAWYTFTGQTSETGLGLGWLDAVHPDDRERSGRIFLDANAKRAPFSLEYRVRRADGTYRWAIDAAAPRFGSAGEFLGFIGSVTDIDERAQLLEAERRSRDSADEARQSAEAAQRIAETANRAKSEFLAAMSHELRTPLNAISGYTQLIELEVHGPITEPQRTALQRVQKSQQHLLALINDILNFAKLEAGRVEYELREVMLADVVRDVSLLVEPQLAARGLAYEVRVGPTVVARADREKLQQVLLNLLSNAIKFTEPGGRVIVDAPMCADGAAGPDVEQLPDDVVFLRVADTGRGIPRERQDEIFDPFVQVHRHLSLPAEGTGLGLAISRDLARGMGGDLRVRSAPGEWATFTVTLPAR